MTRVVFEPDKYQSIGIKHLLRLSFGGLFWPPGMGKTAVVLFVLWCLLRRKMVRRMLVISKVKVVSNVWPREIEKWDFCEGITYALARGGEQRRIEAFESGATVILLNMENTEWLSDQVLGPWKKEKRGGRTKWIRLPPERPHLLDGVDFLVIDESSQFRNNSAKRFQALADLVPRFKRRVILTGSPAPRSLMNLWAQMFIVDMGESLGRFITHFRREYFAPVGPKKWNQWDLKPGSPKKIYAAIAKRILRIGDGKLRMPPLPPPINRMVTMEPEARALYKKMERESLLELEGERVTAANGGVLTAKLRQIANGRVYVSEPDEEKERSGKRGARKAIVIHDEKAQEVLSLIEETQGTPALIGYEHHPDLEALLEALGRDSAVIRGGMSDEESDEIIERWNNGELPWLICQYSVVAHGLNMQDTHANVIYYGIPWDLEVYEQFYRRVWRRGQKETVLRYHILAENTVDDNVCLPGIQAKDDQQQTMLNELEKFMERRKKFEKAEYLVPMGSKSGMFALKDAMESANQRVPKVRTDVDDPGGVLLSVCVKRSKLWLNDVRTTFVAKCTGRKPEEIKPEELNEKNISAMIHEIFGADIRGGKVKPSTWKMWPGGKSKGGEPAEEEETKMATSKAAKSKKGSKKKAAKESTKKAAKSKSVETAPAKDDATYVPVANAKKPKMPVRQKLVKKVADAKGKGIKGTALLEWMEKSLGVSGKRAAGHVAACVKNGFIAKKK